MNNNNDRLSVWEHAFPQLIDLEDDRFKELNDNLDSDNSTNNSNTLPMALKHMEISDKFNVDLKPVNPIKI